MPEHEDLHTALLDLTEPPSIPPDPATLVRRRVVRARRRRGTGTVLVAAAATGAVVAAGSLAGVLSAGPDTGGVAGQPSATPTTTPTGMAHAEKDWIAGGTPTVNDPRRNAKLPPPWKDEPITTFPERNLYAPLGTYLAKGSVEGHGWYAVAHTSYMQSEGCITFDATDHDADTDIGGYVCYDDWPAGRRADWTVTPVTAGRKPSFVTLGSTFVSGAVSAEARSVLIRTTSGHEYRTDAVGTPASDKLRLFVSVVPERNAKVRSVTPLRADGSPAGPPTGLPAHRPRCDNISGTVCVTTKPGPPNGTPSAG